jgi:hypothetical protein
MMLDPTNDFSEIVDGLVAVTHRRPNDAAQAVAHAVKTALRRVDDRAHGTEPAYADVVWHLPASELTDAPWPGDEIVESDGTAWSVVEVAAASRGARWRCVARRLLVFGPDAYVDIEQATFSKGPSGAETAVWNTWKTGVPGTIRPAASFTPTDRRNDAVAAAPAFAAILAEPPLPEGTYRLRAPDGTLYRMIACKPIAGRAGIEAELAAWE